VNGNQPPGQPEDPGASTEPTSPSTVESPLLISDSLATDGGWEAICDVASLLDPADYRLIGGVAVLIHIQLHAVDVPSRATGDADIGVPPSLLRDDSLVARVAEMGYSKTAGNRWERPLASGATAAIDLLVPAYTSRPRSSVQIGSTNTTEVPGLAFALRRPAVTRTVRFQFSQRTMRTARVSVPDEPSLLGLKTLVRTVRDEFRDCEDIWRCLEILHASGQADEFKTDPMFHAARTVLADQMAPNGAAMTKLLGRTAPAERDRRRTRITALVRSATGPLNSAGS
jgi:hypothetical protein